MVWYQLKVAIGQKCLKKERGNKELNFDLLAMNNSSYQNHKSWLTALFINTQDSKIRPSCMERAERTACINGKKKNCEALRNEQKWTENKFIFVIFLVNLSNGWQKEPISWRTLFHLFQFMIMFLYNMSDKSHCFVICFDQPNQVLACSVFVWSVFD